MSISEAITTFLQVFNMSTTMATQVGQVLLERSSMCDQLEIGKFATGGFSQTTRMEMEYVIWNLRAGI
jgi:hypothetical protein